MEGWKLLLVFSIAICYVVSSSETIGVSRCAPDIPCNNFQCIKRNLWCDGEFDCADESDEKYCKAKKWYSSEIPDNKCDGRRHFVCNSGQCVPIEVKCDGFYDCGDYSDEDYCDEQDKDDTSDSLTPIRCGFDGHDVTQIGNLGDSSEDSTVITTPEPIEIYSTSAAPRIYVHQKPGAHSTDHYHARMKEPENQQLNRVSHKRNGWNRRPHNIRTSTETSYENFYNPTSPLTTDQDLTWDPPSSTTPWNAPVATRSFTNSQEMLESSQRALIYDLTQQRERSSVSRDKKKLRTDPLPSFDSEEDYESMRNSYRRKVKEAAELLLEESSSFPSNSIYEVMKYEEMKRRLKFDLGMKLLSFLHDPPKEGIQVHSLADIPNDSEADKEWILYHGKEKGLIFRSKENLAKQNQGVDRISPNSGKHFVLLYEGNMR